MGKAVTLRTFQSSLKFALATMLALAVAGLPASAGVNLWPSCAGGKCGRKKKEVFDPIAQTLIYQLSHNPALMNVEYLKFYIGRPENEQETKARNPRHYYWYDGERLPAYELIETEQWPGSVTEATFIARLDGMGLDFDKLDKFYGSCSRRFYDYSGNPNELFTFAPDTYLSFGCPPGTYKLSQAKIMYRGAPLGAPPQAEMAAAEAAMLSRAEAKANKKMSDSETIPLLIARIKCQPQDPEAHLLLGQALQRTAHIHEAIGEYKLALSLSGDNDDVQKQSLSALRCLHLIDAADPDTRRNLEIVDNGQHIRVVGNEKKSQKRDQTTASAAPGGGSQQ